MAGLTGRDPNVNKVNVLLRFHEDKKLEARSKRHSTHVLNQTQ